MLMLEIGGCREALAFLGICVLGANTYVSFRTP